MRTVNWLVWSGLLLASGCASEAAADPDLTPISSAPASSAAATGPSVAVAGPTVDVALVDDCVDYVPFAAYTGNFYMKVIWDQASQDVTELRDICEQMAIDDPAGLQRMSDEHVAVTKFLEAAAQGTATPVTCAPGSVMGDDGFCSMAPSP